MKIIVLHGEDTNKSYERLKKFINVAKERSWEVDFLDDSNLSIKENLSSSSLFGGERFFILKDIKKLGKK
jgi:DNA polymerase III delta subunit